MSAQTSAPTPPTPPAPQTGPTPPRSAWSRAAAAVTPARVLAVGYVVAGFVLVGLLILATGGDLGVAIRGWFTGAFGTGISLSQTLIYAAPLVLIALGVAPALRAGIISVGAEGQMVVGAILSTIVALWLLPDAPAWIALPLGALAGAIGGAAWAALPALAKNAWGVNEILFTLLANYIAGYLLSFLLRTSLKDPAGAATPRSADLPDAYLLGTFGGVGRLHLGVLLVLALALVALWWSRTRWDFVLGLSGDRPELAARLGFTRGRTVLLTFLVSGAAAGLAGWMQLAGVADRLIPGIASGVGFSGLAVAVLGRGNPIGIVAAGIAYASLTTGSSGIELATGTTPASIGAITQGILLAAAALAVAVNLRSRRRGR